MPRGTGTGRGGPRQGTPGVAYANRTDLAQDYAPQGGGRTAAAGGVSAPTPQAPPAPEAVRNPNEQVGIHPDQVTPLDAPTQRPNVPVTNGLPAGPGASSAPQLLPAGADLAAMAQYLPYLAFAAQRPDTPDSVKAFVNYLQTQVRGPQ